jgi:hypothetical protein
MGTLIDSKPSDPMYSEGPQSYSPHWGRAFLPKPKQRSEAVKLMEDLTEYCAEQKAGPRRWRLPPADSQAHDRDLNGARRR